MSMVESPNPTTDDEDYNFDDVSNKINLDKELVNMVYEILNNKIPKSNTYSNCFIITF